MAGILRLVSYNVLGARCCRPQHYAGKESVLISDPLARQKAIVNRLGLLGEASPTVALLQEDDFVLADSYIGNEIQQKYHFTHFGWNHATNEWSSKLTAFGLSILVDKKVSKDGFDAELKIAVGKDDDKRTGLAVKIGGVVYATFHLSGAPAAFDQRAQELDEFSQAVMRFANGCPIIIGGDSNEVPSMEKAAYRTMKTHWGDFYANTGEDNPTFSTPTIDWKRVDWLGGTGIVLSNVMQVRRFTDRLPTDTEPSDHLPIGISFQAKPNA